MTSLVLYQRIYDILHLDLTAEKHSLTEDGELATCRSVSILSSNSQYLVYKFDNLPARMKLFPFFKNSSVGHMQMCDYVIFYYQNNKLSIFICNLKSKKLSNSHDQVLNGYLFSKFITEIASYTLKIADVDSLVEFKGVHFTSQKGVKKTSTKPGKSLFKDEYSNGLRYTILSCSSPCNIDALSKM